MDILSILQWALPSGGIGAAIAWFIHRSAVNAKDAKTVHDTYKQMYHDLGAELERLQVQINHQTDVNRTLCDKIKKLTDENDELRKAINRLRSTLLEIKRCPHYADCPVRSELRDAENAVGRGTDKRQYNNTTDTDRGDDSGSTEVGHGESDTDKSNDRCIAGRCGIQQSVGNDNSERKKDINGSECDSAKREGWNGDCGSSTDGTAEGEEHDRNTNSNEAS